jgi:hypothetical protein
MTTRNESASKFSEKKANDFTSKLDLIRGHVDKKGIKGIVVNPHSSVFKFRKGANHSKL